MALWRRRRHSATGIRKAYAESEKSNREQRGHPRMRLRTLVHVLFLGDDLHCRLQDLSVGGLSFVSPVRISVGERVTVVLDPPEGGYVPPAVQHGVTLVGRVVSARESTKDQSCVVGVQFDFLEDRERDSVLGWFEYFGQEAEHGMGVSRHSSDRFKKISGRQKKADR